MLINAYAKLIDLSSSKDGPENVGYITVKNRNKRGDYVKVAFSTWLNKKKEHIIYFDSKTSEKLKKAFEIIHSIESGEKKLVNT